MRGMIHYALGSVAFRKGERHWLKAERRLMPAHYFLTRLGNRGPETLESPCRPNRIGFLMRSIAAGWAKEARHRLRIINRKVMERDEQSRRLVESLPGLFESEYRDLNLPLFLTHLE